MYILDSNILTFILKFPRQYPHLLERIKQTPYEQIWISVISVDEALTGAYKELHQKHKPVSCYQLLKWIVTEYGKYQILTYDNEDIRIFGQFSSEICRKVGIEDRRIAATALRHQYTVVTQNMRDFEPTGAKCEDWTSLSTPGLLFGTPRS